MVLTDTEITESTTLWVTIQVRNRDGSVRALAGATFSAILGRVDLQYAGTAVVLDALQGLVQVRFPAATNLRGQIVASAHMTLGSETQCIWRERFQVFPNLEP